MLIYKTILNKEKYENTIKKSNFISRIKRVYTEEDALNFIDEVKSENRGANHNCYAYILGEKSMIQRYSDDGEPQATAGIPILEVLKKENLTNVCVVVTRYFGGVKLGASGLIRAYTDGCSGVVNISQVVEVRDYYVVKCILDYSFVGKFDNWISNSLFYEIDRSYEEIISLRLYVDVDLYDKFSEEINNLTSGQIRFEIIENNLLFVKNREIMGGKYVRT